MSLNKYQLVVTRRYANGDFAHVQNMTDCDMVGDTLFLFIMRELNDPDMDRFTALDRLERAAADISDAYDAIDTLIKE